MVSVDALTSWWERMTDERRTELLQHLHLPLSPDLALQLWQDSGWLPVVRPGRSSATGHGLVWRFAPEVEEFLAERLPGPESAVVAEGSSGGEPALAVGELLVRRPTG